MTWWKGETACVDRPDILIVEGVNVLLAPRLSREGREIPFVSDFFDFSVYLDAPEDVLERWYVERFRRLRETAFRDPRSYFRKYADLDEAETMRVAKDIWTRINLQNLRQNIAPTRAAREPDPDQGRGSPHRGSGAKEVVGREFCGCHSRRSR